MADTAGPALIPTLVAGTAGHWDAVSLTFIANTAVQWHDLIIVVAEIADQ